MQSNERSAVAEKSTPGWINASGSNKFDALLNPLPAQWSTSLTNLFIPYNNPILRDSHYDFYGNLYVSPVPGNGQDFL